MKSVLKVRNLNKIYPKFSLKDVSFEIPEGCVAGFIGLNGQGKTTTIRALLGLAKKESGDIFFFGKPFDENSKEILDETGVVFDSGYLYECMKLKEMKNIISKGYSNWDENEYKRYMEIFGLDENQYISTLSKGMKMKFSLVLALSHHSKFLIMDEPTSGLDPIVRMELLEILNEYMQKEGEGILYSTHITSDLEKFADILIFIHEGRIIFVEDKDKLLEEHKIVKGGKDKLSEDIKKLFINLSIKEYSFEGLTKEPDRIKEFIPDALFERPNIENIMLAYIKRGEI